MSEVAIEEVLERPAWLRDPSSGPASKKGRGGDAGGSNVREEARKAARGQDALIKLVLILGKLVLTDSRALAEVSNTVYR
eukprot:3060000-Pyramimonas_sp.AAC.1